MAAMAAVRYSMLHPLVYGQVNVQGTMNLLDAARLSADPANPPRGVRAATGSVYGTSTPVPFTESAPADRPLAPYPASKRAMELMAHCYSHLWKLPTTIVRFFNVYGPHGRPDMMPWQWTLDILASKPLTLYNNGHISRDWTYIDDIVTGLILALDNPPPWERRSPDRPSSSPSSSASPHESHSPPSPGFEIFNLGCSNPIENLRFVEVLEELLGKKAQILDTPTPPTEPLITYANITKAREQLGLLPQNPNRTRPEELHRSDCARRTHHLIMEPRMEIRGFTPQKNMLSLYSNHRGWNFYRRAAYFLIAVVLWKGSKWREQSQRKC